MKIGKIHIKGIKTLYKISAFENNTKAEHKITAAYHHKFADVSIILISLFIMLKSLEYALISKISLNITPFLQLSFSFSIVLLLLILVNAFFVINEDFLKNIEARKSSIIPIKIQNNLPIKIFIPILTLSITKVFTLPCSGPFVPREN
jgi:hypothetical protein